MPLMSAETPSASSLAAALARRLRGRADSEHEQALVRIVIVLVLALYFGALSVTRPADPHAFALGTYVALGYGAMSTGVLAWIVAVPRAYPVRRLIAMVCDHTTLATLLVLGGPWGGALYPIYLWVTFGNGFRYGNRYLAASAGVSVLAFAIAGWLNPFWHDNIALTVGLALGLIVLPAYVASLIKKLTVAKRHAEAANHAKSRFLATMSHELRTPLNSVIGLSDLMTATRLDGDQRAMIDTIGNSGRTLLDLINEILDLAKIEAGKTTFDVQDFDLVAELANTLAIVRPEAERKGLELSLVLTSRLPVRARGDVRQLRQIWLNLLANAVKFTDSGQVWLRADVCWDQKAPQLTVRVTDTGPGVRDAERERIFEAFSQSDQTTHRRHEGTGLGLAIARQVAQSMGGSLDLENSSPNGSTFVLRVPLDRAVGAPEQAPEEVEEVRVSVENEPAHAALTERLRAAGARLTDPESALVAVYTAHPSPGQTPAAADPQSSPVMADQAQGPVSAAVPAVVLGGTDAGKPEQLVRHQVTVLAPGDADTAALRDALTLARAARANEEGCDSLAASIADRSGAGRRVLVVEDNPVNRMVTAKILEAAGHVPVVVESGEAALDRLESGDIAAVLMDVNMPGESGIDTVKLLRFTEMGSRACIPVIALTADATAETRTACLDAGMDAFVTKPVNARQLLDVLAAHLDPANATPARGESEPVVSVAGPGADTPALDAGAIATLYELDPFGLFLREVAEEFITDSHAVVRQVHHAAAAGDLAAAQDLLHGLKSAAGYAGAARVRRLAVDLHAALARGDRSSFDAAAAGLAREVEAYRLAVNGRRPDMPLDDTVVELPRRTRETSHL